MDKLHIGFFDLDAKMRDIKNLPITFCVPLDYDQKRNDKFEFT